MVQGQASGGFCLASPHCRTSDLPDTSSSALQTGRVRTPAAGVEVRPGCLPEAEVSSPPECELVPNCARKTASSYFHACFLTLPGCMTGVRCFFHFGTLRADGGLWNTQVQVQSLAQACIQLWRRKSYRILPAFLSITVICAGFLKCIEEDSKKHKKCHWSSSCGVVQQDFSWRDATHVYSPCREPTTHQSTNTTKIQ